MRLLFTPARPDNDAVTAAARRPVNQHGRRVTVYAYAAPVDTRKGFEGLCALVTHGPQRDPLSGDVFLFLSRNRVRT